MNENNIEEILLTTMSNDISICKTEKFDIDMATWLTQQDTISYIEKGRISKMLKQRTKGNQFEAFYKLGKNSEGTIGRFTILKGIGLQGLPRDIRAALAKNYYWDLDFKNCQMELSLQECKKQGWPHSALEYYCNNRDQLFEDFNRENPTLYTRQFIKEEFIKVIFGGKPSYNAPEWIKNVFYPEAKTFMVNICATYPKLFEKIKKLRDTESKKNPMASTCALFLQTQERRCLMALDNFLGKNGRYMGVLIHDGGYAEKLDGELEFPKSLMSESEDFVFETTGFRLKLVIKPIETTFKCDNKRIINKDKTYPLVKSYFELKNFKCIDNGCYYELLEDFSFKIRTRLELKTAFEHLTYEDIDTKTNMVIDEQFIDRWIKDKNIRVYKKVELYPPPLKCPANHFNLWNGYEIENITIKDTYDGKYIQEGLDFIINHWKLLSGDEYFDFFLKCIAYKVQFPGIKTKIVLYIHSKPGLGKERGLYYPLEQIYGNKYCLITDNINDIFGDFNGLIENKFIVVMDEMKISDSAKFQEQIKAITTRNLNTINNKSIKKYEVQNFTQLMGFSNVSGFKVQEECRRSIPFDRWEIPRPTPEYINKLVEYTGNKAIIKKLFDYLMSIDVSKFQPDVERPITTYYNELIEASLPIETQFFIYLIENAPDLNIIEHSAIELFRLFKDFLKDCFTEIKYTSSMRSLVLKLSKLECNGFDKIHKRNGNVWTFDIKKCKEWCQDKGYIKKRLLK